MSSDTIKVFVYGTLMSGMPLHGGLGYSKFVKHMRVSFYKLVQAPGVWYPAMVRGIAADSVKGELYEVEKWMTPTLEWLEGHPHLFKMSVIGVADKEVQFVNAFVGEDEMFYDDDAIKIPNGDWREHVRTRESAGGKDEGQAPKAHPRR